MDLRRTRITLWLLLSGLAFLCAQAGAEALDDGAEAADAALPTEILLQEIEGLRETSR